MKSTLLFSSPSLLLAAVLTRCAKNIFWTFHKRVQLAGKLSFQSGVGFSVSGNSRMFPQGAINEIFRQSFSPGDSEGERVCLPPLIIRCTE